MSKIEQIAPDIIEVAKDGGAYEMTTGALAMTMLAAVLHLRDEIPDGGGIAKNAQERAAELCQLTRAKCFQFATMAADKALPGDGNAKTRECFVGSLANAIMALVELGVTAEACGLSHTTARGFVLMASQALERDTLAAIVTKGGAA